MSHGPAPRRDNPPASMRPKNYHYNPHVEPTEKRIPDDKWIPEMCVYCSKSEAGPDGLCNVCYQRERFL